MSENSLTKKSKNILTLEILFFFFCGFGIDHGLYAIKALYSSNKSEYYSHIALFLW